MCHNNGIKRGKVKRGLIDGLGTMIKSITGNLDANDARQINDQIVTIAEKQKTIENVLKENLQIMELWNQL